MMASSNTLISLWKGLQAGLVVLALLAMAGCSSTASRVAVPYALELTVDKQVNPDHNGRPSPVQVTIYELTSSSAFASRDFFSLQADPQAALGKELINSHQVVLRPGEIRTIEYPGSTEARLVGVVAAYRDLEHSQWRLVVELPEPQSTNIFKVWQFSPNEETIKISVKDNEVTVTDRDRSWWPF